MSLSVSLTNDTGVKLQLDMGSPEIAPPDLRNLGKLPSVQAALGDLDKLRAAWSDVVSTQVYLQQCCNTMVYHNKLAVSSTYNIAIL
jgi:hypothetical protein